MSIWTAAFWKATAERVLSTAAQAAIAILTADGFNLLNIRWQGVLATVGLAALLSLLKSLVANQATRTGPSLTLHEQVIPPETGQIKMPDH